MEIAGGFLKIVDGGAKSSDTVKISDPKIDMSDAKFQKIIHCEDCGDGRIKGRQSSHGSSGSSGGSGGPVAI